MLMNTMTVLKPATGQACIRNPYTAKMALPKRLIQRSRIRDFISRAIATTSDAV